MMPSIYKHKGMYRNHFSKKVSALAALLFVVVPHLKSVAQDMGEWEWFGSLQTIFFTQFSKHTEEINTPERNYTNTITADRSTFAMQQMDFFINKPIDDKFNVFIDLEFKMNFSTEKQWGELSLQEAWLNYAHSSAFNIKAGLLYPAFNHLNEIKNRLALLPYVFRPIVYERLLSEQFSLDDYTPETAFLQFHGAVPVSDWYFDYALYMGNAESSYLSTGSGGKGDRGDPDHTFEFLSGADKTDLNLKLYGTRVGFRSLGEALKFGISATHDYNNFRDTTSLQQIGVQRQYYDTLRGDAPRIRLGADFSLRFHGFTFESEFIKVLYHYDAVDKLPIVIEQDFFRVFLGYNIIPELIVYASGSQIRNQAGDTHKLREVDLGAAYSFNDNITAKVQYISYTDKFTPWYGVSKTHIDFIFLGCSVLL